MTLLAPRRSKSTFALTRNRALITSVVAIGIAVHQPVGAEIPTGTGLKVDITNRTVARVERSSVQGERFGTRENETFEILLSDGSSITLAPGSSIIIHQYAFDPANGSGHFSAELLSGSLRLMGGRLNQSAPLLVRTAAASLRLADGGAFVSLEGDDLRASLLAGALDIESGGVSRRIDKPGFEVVVRKDGASAPRRQQRGQAFADAAIINPGLRLGGMAKLVLAEEREPAGKDGAETDTQLVRSEVLQNQPAGSLNFANLGGPITLPGGGTVSLGDAAVASQSSLGSTSLNDADPDLRLAQHLLPYDPTFLDCAAGYCVRNPGRSSNRLLESGSFEFVLSGTGPGSLAQDGFPDNDLTYVFSSGLTEDSGRALGIIIDPLDIDNQNAPGSIVFLGEIYTAVANRPDYFENAGRIIGFDGDSSQYFIPTSFESQDLFLLTGNPDDAFLVDAGSGAVVVPLTNFPTSGRISVTHVSGPVVAGFNGASRTGDFGPDGESLTLAFFGINRPDTYGEYASYLQDAASTGNIDVNLAILQQGFGPLTRPSGSNFGQPMTREPNNFLFFQQTSTTGTNFVFATGDVSSLQSRLASGPTIDSFAITRGLIPVDLAPGLTFRNPDAPLSFRAFLPSATLPNGLNIDDLQSTPLYVANPSASSTSRLYHADFGLSADGRASTISATFGTLTYADGVLDNDRAQVTLDAATIGSTHSASTGSLALTSPLFATSVGGAQDRPGYASYLVLENVSEAENSLAGGTIDPLSGANETQYGLLRLASHGARVDRGTIPASANTGYVAGLVETPTSGTLQLGRLNSLSVNPADNSVSASLNFGGVSLQLGGAGQASAFVDRANYGAAVQSATANAAVVAGEGAVGDASAFARIQSYQHVQWGFFFGDIRIPALGSTDPRLHTALSTWVAGERWTGAPVQTLQGQATYTGHAIGSVVANGASRVDVGSFTQNWNFSSRDYSMQLIFPEPSGGPRDLIYTISLVPNAAPGVQYTGLSGLVENVQASINGELVGNGSALPQGSIGQFQLLNTSGTYAVAGTFAGDTGTGP